MNISLNQYIINPQGKNNAVLNATAREAIRTSYIKKYDTILLRERGNIVYNLYKDSKHNRYYAYFKIPSETVEKFYYDVVLEFYTDENVKNTEDLFDYNVKFYSNDPAFVYTYAYVFEHNNLFVDGMESRMSRKALRKEAKDKNPYNQVGYVKTIYFAYLTMKSKGLNKLNKFTAECSKFSLRELLSKVEQADIKIEQREAEGAKLAKKKSKPKSEKNESDNVKTVKNTLGVKNVKNISTVKNTKTIGFVKKTKRK